MTKKDKGLLDAYLYVVSRLIHWGELLKAYTVLRNAPACIEDNKDVKELICSLNIRLGDIAEYQQYGSLDGRYNLGFIDPEDITKVVKFQLLKQHVKTLSLKSMVDIGCYTGWVGRNLSLDGIKCLGIDIHPLILFVASKMAVGTLASFECVHAQQLGYLHPREFDGAILFDIIEHCFDYRVIIKSAEMSVREGGWVFISLPHPKAEQSAELSPLQLHEHLYSFSKKKLERLFKGRRNLSIGTVINEGGCPMWFISYQV